MKVILCEDVMNLGATGETVRVADGYARNYLIPRRLAVRMDSGSAKQMEHERRVIRSREEKRRSQLAGVAKALEALTVEIQVRAGAEEKIFGSVTAANIVEKLAEQGQMVDRRLVLLEEPLRALGIYVVPVRLARDIEANVKVWVSGIEEAVPAPVVAEEVKAPEAS